MITDMIEETPEYRQLVAEQPGGAGSASTAPGTTVGDALGPVTDWEKGDVEFWLQVAQLIVLLLILREVSR